MFIFPEIKIKVYINKQQQKNILTFGPDKE